MRLLRGAWWVVAALAVGATVATPASAVETTALSGIKYVALGDSYAAGVGLANYDADSAECYRSPTAYGPVWAANHGVASFTFAACSGATTEGVKAQTAALAADTRLVTVSVGGNDVGFSSVLAACRFGTDQQCDGALAGSATAIQSVLPARLAETYQLIATAAPRARVAAVGYPHLFELGTCVGDDFAEVRRARINELADSLADVTAAAVAAAGRRFVFVDTRAYFAGHGVCSTTPWIHALRAQTFESYHANQEGHDHGFYPALTEALCARPVTA
ncbi:SGNH/GDSL hydrolase family protein [Actinomycetes bacterium KLBMP 9797]